MKTNKIFTLLASIFLMFQLQAQTDSLGISQNSADKLLASQNNLTIGGYAQVDYNQGFDHAKRSNGILDVHRMVILLGYRFNSRTQFVSELEFEHVSEVYVEQAFLQYKMNSFINFKGGLMLIPMGLINEYHEPTAFNGVERPLIDNYISPTTWREVGAGFNGVLPSWGLKYQAYVVNGFNGYNGSGKLNGKKGLRDGRQKGAESFASSPNFTARIDYFGLKNFQLGASFYYGNTQSTLYNGIDKKDAVALAKADSSVVGISMIGLDARYKIGGLQLKGQYYLTTLSNTDAYNVFTKKPTANNDLGSSMTGAYAEAAYTIGLGKNSAQKLIPFVRYEYYNTHNAVGKSTNVNKAYANNVIICGLGWKMSDYAVLKADVQFVKPESTMEYSNTFNAGIGVMF